MFSSKHLLSLVELLPLSWIRRCLTLVCRTEGVGAIIGRSVFALFILSLGSLLSLVVVFSIFCDSAVCFLSALQEGWQRWQLSLFTFSSGHLFTFGWNFSLLVSLLLLISLVCYAEKSWQRSLTSGVSLLSRGDGEQWFSSVPRPYFFLFFWSVPPFYRV